MLIFSCSRHLLQATQAALPLALACGMKIALYSHSVPPAVDGVSRRFSSIIHELYKAGHQVGARAQLAEASAPSERLLPVCTPQHSGRSKDCSSVDPLQVIIFTLEKEPCLERILFPGEKPGRFKYVQLESTFHELYPSKRIAAPTLGNMLQIGATLLRERPAVVHCTADAVTLQFGLAAKLLGIPVVTSIHTDVQLGLAAVGAPSLALYLTNLKECMESQLLDGCATTSPSFRVKLRGQGVICDHVVKTAVLVDQFRPDQACDETRRRLTFGNTDGFLIVFVGRLAPEKVRIVARS